MIGLPLGWAVPCGSLAPAHSHFLVILQILYSQLPWILNYSMAPNKVKKQRNSAMEIIKRLYSL